MSDKRRKEHIEDLRLVFSSVLFCCFVFYFLVLLFLASTHSNVFFFLFLVTNSQMRLAIF